MRRDTVLVQPHGHIVLRFRSDNPGVWLFHWYVSPRLVSSFFFFILPPRSLVGATYTNTPASLLGSNSHIEWHVASGLSATIIERPLDIQTQLSGRIPADHWQVCRDGRVPTAGNAAANTQDVLDLRGENTSPGELPAGFTARGIVALAFSCVAAFAGMAVIGWYGMKPVKNNTTPSM